MDKKMPEPTELGYATSAAMRERKPLLRWWVPLLGVAGFVGAILIVNRLTIRSNTPPRVVCAANLGHIGRSCWTYAESSNGMMPSSLDLLTQGGRRALCLPKQLVCLTCGRKYDYIPGRTIHDDPRTVLAYEPLSNHGGTGANVLRVDGSVKWMGKNEYDKVMAEFGPTTTRPAPATSPVSHPRAFSN